MTGQLKNKTKITLPKGSVNQFINQLNNNTWFSCLPETVRQVILSDADCIEFAKDTPVFRTGETFNGIYAVLEGAVQLSYANPHGNEAVAAIADPIMWFGEISLVDAQPRTHDALCVKKSTVLFLSHQTLLDIFKQHPTFWFHIAQLTSHKLRMLCTELISIQTQTLQQRLTHRLWLILNGYGTRLHIEQRTISITQEQLAAMLFCARQSINIELQQLEKEKIIALSFKKIEILDLNRLKQLAECAHP